MFYKIRIMLHSGTWFDCWQHIEGGSLVGYVKEDGETPQEMPDEFTPYDAHIFEKKPIERPDTDAAAAVWAKRAAKAEADRIAAEAAAAKAQEAAQAGEAPK